ncbi:MAG: hypothetical protein HPY53_11180 [Brevinematales bacterium]|nr:hypothetical protein [Brevinematales bacterium]
MSGEYLKVHSEMGFNKGAEDHNTAKDLSEYRMRHEKMSGNEFKSMINKFNEMGMLDGITKDQNVEILYKHSYQIENLSKIRMMERSQEMGMQKELSR